MKVPSEADTEEQIQELKTITRLQGEAVARMAQGAQGLLSAGLSVLTQGQSRASGLVATLLLKPKHSWGRNQRARARIGQGERRSWGLPDL